jgi:hypothetical protein
MAGYSIKWREYGEGDRIVAKKKNFRTDLLRERFVSALTERENFREIVAWSDQKGEKHEASQHRR